MNPVNKWHRRSMLLNAQPTAINTAEVNDHHMRRKTMAIEKAEGDDDLNYPMKRPKFQDPKTQKEQTAEVLLHPRLKFANFCGDRPPPSKQVSDEAMISYRPYGSFFSGLDLAHTNSVPDPEEKARLFRKLKENHVKVLKKLSHYLDMETAALDGNQAQEVNVENLREYLNVWENNVLAKQHMLGDLLQVITQMKKKPPLTQEQLEAI